MVFGFDFNRKNRQLELVIDPTDNDTILHDIIVPYLPPVVPAGQVRPAINGGGGDFIFDEVGLFARWQGGSGVTTPGGDVTDWADQSPNSEDLAGTGFPQESGGVIQLDGINDFLNVTFTQTPFPLAEFAIYIVLKFNTDTVVQAVVDTLTAPTRGFGLSTVGASGSMALKMDSSPNTITFGTNHGTTKKHIVIMNYGSNLNSMGYQDTNIKQASAGFNTGALLPTGMQVGQFNGGTNRLNADIYEIGIYSKYLTPAQVANLGGFLGEEHSTAFTITPTPVYTVEGLVYPSNEFDISSQENSPNGMTWNDDGTKFFVCGFTNKTLYEYTVSVPWDLGSTVAYSGNSFDLSTEAGNPQGVEFNTDGTKFFVVHNTTNTVYEYTCSVGFDLSSTVAYSGESFSVAGQESVSLDIRFNPAGTKMFIIGQGNNAVWEYNLATAFSMITLNVTYSGNTLDIDAQENSAGALDFSADGTRMFIMGTSNATFFEYSLSIGYDLGSTVAYTGISHSVNATDASTTSMKINDDGSKIFVVGAQNDNVYEFTLA